MRRSSIFFAYNVLRGSAHDSDIYGQEGPLSVVDILELIVVGWHTKQGGEWTETAPDILQATIPHEISDRAGSSNGFE